MHIHLDPIGGVAGDMFVAALADAFPAAAKGLKPAVAALGAPASVRWRLAGHLDHALVGKRFMVAERAGGSDHARFAEVRRRLLRSRLQPRVRGRAVAIYTLLAEAEARIHGVPRDRVTFHELGRWDSIVDVAAAAHLIEAVGPARWTVGPLPMGSGRVDSAHGVLPVPAPAAAVLLKGFLLHDDGVPGERVTPTGAAILRQLRCGVPDGVPRRLDAVGIGFGARVLKGVSNVLRVLVFDAAGARAPASELVTEIAFEVDDQTPEDLGLALERVRAVPGVLDAVQFPAFGKKGRMMVSVRIMARPEAEDAAIEACFRETTTIGLRVAHLRRAVLPRREVRAGRVRVKLSERPDGVTAKAAVDDVAGEVGHAARTRARRRAEDMALSKARARRQS